MSLVAAYENQRFTVTDDEARIGKTPSVRSRCQRIRIWRRDALRFGWSMRRCLICVGLLWSLIANLGCTSNEVTNKDVTPDSKHREADLASDKTATATTKNAEKPAAASDSVTDSVYAVLVASEDRQQVYQVGTAWAVSPQRLVTSGAVVLAVERLRQNLGVVLIRHPVTKSDFFVAERAHPRFVELIANANQLQAQLAELDRQLDKATDAAEKQTLEQKLQELDMQLIAQLRETMYFDIGILEVRDRLPHVLPQTDTTLAMGQRLRLVGVPFPEDEQLLNPDRPLQHREISGQLLALLPQIESASSPVVFNAAIKDLQGQQWSGAPVLNSSGQVVAVFSRLAPPDIKGPPDPKQLRPHATDIRALRELMSLGETAAIYVEHRGTDSQPKSVTKSPIAGPRALLIDDLKPVISKPIDKSDKEAVDFARSLVADIQKAQSMREAAIKKAGDELIKELNREIATSRRKNLAADLRARLIQALSEEKDAFQANRLIPWSVPMRKASIGYLKAVSLADKPLESAFDNAISHFTKTRDDNKVQSLCAEKQESLKPWTIAVWEFVQTNKTNKQGKGATFKTTLFSNGKLDQADGKNVYVLESEKLTMWVHDPKAPTGAWINECVIADDGRTMSAKNNVASTFTCRLLQNATK